MLRQRQHRIFSPTQITAPVWAARLSQGDPGGFTVARATTGTNFDANGILQTAAINAARFEHDPATGRKLGLLVEESRTNYYFSSNDVRSQANGNAVNAWVNVQCGPGGVGVAPDGNNTAYLMAENTATNVWHQFYQTKTVAASIGTLFHWSICAKPAGRSYVRLAGNVSWRNPPPVSYFDLQKGLVTTSANCTGFARKIGNGFSRVGYSTDTTVTNPFVTNEVDLANTDATGVYTGDGVSGAYFWGAQFEVGAYPLSYIPTTSASVTRSADSAAQAFTPAAQSTLLVVFQAPVGMTSTGTRTLLQLDDGTANNRIRIETVTGALRAVFTSGGADQATLNLGTLTSFAHYKLALGWRNGDFAACLNGGQIVTAPAGGTVPSTNTMRAGHDHTPANHWNGAVGDILYWDGRLSNQQLQGASRV